MGVLKKIGDFLFGRNPNIFDEKGNVKHQHPDKKWKDWENRLKSNSHYNWRNHTGTMGGRKNG